MPNIPGIYPKFLPNLTWTDPYTTFVVAQGANDAIPGKIPIANLSHNGGIGTNGTTWQITIGDPNGTLTAENVGDLALLSESGFVFRADANGTMNWQNQAFTLKGDNGTRIRSSNGGLSPEIVGELWIDGSEWEVPVKVAVDTVVGPIWNYTDVFLRGANGTDGNLSLTWENVQPLVGSQVLYENGTPPSGGNVSNYPAVFISKDQKGVYTGIPDDSNASRTGNFTLIGYLTQIPFTIPAYDPTVDYVTQSIATVTAGQFWIATTGVGIGGGNPDVNPLWNRIVVTNGYTGKFDPAVLIEAIDITLNPTIGGFSNLADLLQYLYDNI